MLAVNYEYLSDLVIEKIYSVSTIYTEKNKKAKRRNRPVWALVIKYEGETRYISNGKEYVSNIKNIVILPKGSNYDWRCIESGCFSIIEFECKKTCSDIFSFKVKNGDRLLDVIKKTERNMTLKKSSYMLDGFKNLYGLISSLLKTVDDTYVSSEKNQKIIPAIEYIAENYNKKICNDDLASITGLSTVYFRKLFKEVTGISPINYIISVRIKKARRMLQSDHSGITDIAYSLGYNNVYEFSKEFKKHMGVSPLNYVKQLKKPAQADSRETGQNSKE